MELFVFIVAALMSLVGGVGLVASKNPVHSALMLILSLFGIAVLFLNQDAQFLAAVQIIVYAGAIVVLFLFVIMLLGVDQSEDLSIEPIAGQRRLAVVIAAGVAILSIVFVAFAVDGGVTGEPGATAPKVDSLTGTQVSSTEQFDDNQTSGTEINSNTKQLGRTLFTDYVFAFEITGLLLTIAVVGAVLLARRPKGELIAVGEPRTMGAMAPHEEGSS